MGSIGLKLNVFHYYEGGINDGEYDFIKTMLSKFSSSTPIKFNRIPYVLSSSRVFICSSVTCNKISFGMVLFL